MEQNTNTKEKKQNEKKAVPTRGKFTLPKLVDKERMCTLLRITPAVLNNLVESNEIPYIRIDLPGDKEGKILFDKKEVWNWFRQKATFHTPQN